MSRLTWTTVAVVGWPLFAATGYLAAGWLPDDQIWAAAVSAVLWSTLPWMGVLWPIWTALVTHRLGHPRPWMLVSLLGLALVGVPVQCLPAASSSDDGGPRVAVWNVNAYSPDPTPDPLFRTVDALSPDLLIILERRFDDIPGYERIADDFAGHWPRPSHHTAVYQRAGLHAEARITPQLGSASMAMPVAVVWLPRAKVCVLGVHAPPQVPKNATGMAPYVTWVVERIAEGRVVGGLEPCPVGAPVVMSGDFNHVPGSGYLQRFRAAGLTDVVAGTGLFGVTWPSGGGWPDFPVFRLDHVLAGPAEVSELEKTLVPGSDHQGWVFRVRAD